MTDQEIIKILLDIPEETQTVEFKRLKKSTKDESNVVKSVTEAIVGMANAEGGLIVLGIDDPEKTIRKGLDRIFGIEGDKENFDAIGREIQRIIPPLASIWPPQIVSVEDFGKTVALIHVPKCLDDFRQLNGKVFLRQQKSNREITSHEIVMFSYAKGFRKADIELVDVSLHLLDTEIYRQWSRTRSAGKNIEDILERAGLARRNADGKILPTRAAVLLFAEYPTNLMDTKCAIRIFQIAGTIETVGAVPNYVGVPDILQGPAVELIRLAQETTLRLLRSGVEMPRSGFVNKYRIPERAIIEAITNAVIHRDYFSKRDIEIKIFENRVEIESPGLFPFNITPANIGYVRSSGYRNDLLVKILREMPNRPNWDQNEGVRAMREEMHARNLYPPIFYTYPYLQDAVRVVLFNEIQATEWEKISHYLKQNKYINNEIARKITGVVDKDKMSKLFKKWMNQNLLIKIVPLSASKKLVKYRLPETEDLKRF